MYPDGQLRQLQQLPSVMSMDVTDMVQMLAQQPREEVYEVTVSQVVGEPCREAWDVLPLTIADVSKATRVDPVYGKLFNAVRSGNLADVPKSVTSANGDGPVYVTTADMYNQTTDPGSSRRTRVRRLSVGRRTLVRRLDNFSIYF